MDTPRSTNPLAGFSSKRGDPLDAMRLFCGTVQEEDKGYKIDGGISKKKKKKA
jgi:hypothetical protein